MTTGRRGARAIAAILGIALVASAVVVYLLIRVTAPAAGGDEGLAAVTSEGTVVSATPGSDVSPGSGSLGSSPTDPDPSTARSSTGTSPADGSTRPTSTTSPQPQATTSRDGTGDPSSSSSAPTSLLPGSAVPLPAAWSGTAQMDITVIGNCPGAQPSHYTTPADIAMDVAGGGAAATESGSTTGVGQGAEPTLTIGVNTAAVPTLAVYSAAVDNSGTFRRFWSLSVARSGTRTAIAGTVVNDDLLDGNNPNILVDSMKPPAGCADIPVSGLPRVLAIGSTLSGWVDARSAEFTLSAITADGQRAVRVTIIATRSQ